MSTAGQARAQALVRTAVVLRGAFAVAGTVASGAMTVRMFGSRFDGRVGTVFGLLFAASDAALGVGLARARPSPRRQAGWLAAGAAVDAGHTVLAAINPDATPRERAATVGMIGSLTTSGLILAVYLASRAR